MLSRNLLLAFFISLCFFSCTRESYVMAPRQTLEQAMANRQMPDSLDQKFRNGADFYASGNDPVAWSLTMDYEGQFSFLAPENNLSLIAKPGVVSSEGTNFNLEDAAGTMDINLLNTGCKGSNTNETYVTVNNKLYKGCGQALYDKKLEGSWLLYKIQNKEIAGKDYPNGIPDLKFRTLSNQLDINTGCDHFTLNYTIVGDKITIPALPGKNKNCETTLEARLDKSFYGHTFSYVITDNVLYVYLIDDSIISFKKKN